ncbi:hypothetical protein CLAIMM_06612, partial [Cladophialophora immunda]
RLLLIPKGCKGKGTLRVGASGYQRPGKTRTRPWHGGSCHTAAFQRADAEIAYDSVTPCSLRLCGQQHTTTLSWGRRLRLAFMARDAMRRKAMFGGMLQAAVREAGDDNDVYEPNGNDRLGNNGIDGGDGKHSSQSGWVLGIDNRIFWCAIHLP